MFEEQKKQEVPYSDEAKQSWLGFWSLLLEIDKRNQPERYKKPLKENDD